ncbi:unnamed protein product [Cuscuta epithymum]|nr:unnamed protein product [Cuscuta epithymum]
MMLNLVRNLIKVLWSFAGVSPELVKVGRSWSKFTGISQSSTAERRTRLSSLKFQVGSRACYYRSLLRGIQGGRRGSYFSCFCFENNLNNAHGHYFEYLFGG